MGQQIDGELDEDGASGIDQAQGRFEDTGRGRRGSADDPDTGMPASECLGIRADDDAFAGSDQGFLGKYAREGSFESMPAEVLDDETGVGDFNEIEMGSVGEG